MVLCSTEVQSWYKAYEALALSRTVSTDNYPLLQCQSSSDSVGKSIRLEFRNPHSNPGCNFYYKADSCAWTMCKNSWTLDVWHSLGGVVSRGNIFLPSHANIKLWSVTSLSSCSSGNSLGAPCLPAQTVSWIRISGISVSGVSVSGIGIVIRS